MRRAGTVGWLLLVVLSAACGQAEPTPRSALTTGPGWSQAPAAPLSARHSARAVTVGDEVLVLGGDASPLCPSGASCAYPPQPLKDGAAYSPGTSTWRRLADAPVAPSTGSVAVLEGLVYVLAAGRLHAYDPEKDAWSELPAPPDRDGMLVPAGDRLLRLEPTQEHGVQPDHLYDPGSKTWKELPRDPLAPAYDRGAVWNGERLVLLGKALPAAPDSEPTGLRAATLDLGSWTWSSVPKGEVVLGFGTLYSWTGDRVLVPYVFDYTAGGANPGGAKEPTGGLLDLTSGRWERLPEPPARPRPALRVEAVSRELVTAGEGFVLDVPALRWHALAPAEGAPTEGTTASWVGRQLVVFGGGTVSASGRGLTADTWVWTAPG